MLGHAVPFKYCRSTVDGVPCRKIMDCWFEILPIREYVEKHFSSEEREKIFSAPGDKVTSLLDLIQKAKKNKGE